MVAGGGGGRGTVVVEVEVVDTAAVVVGCSPPLLQAARVKARTPSASKTAPADDRVTVLKPGLSLHVLPDELGVGTHSFGREVDAVVLEVLGPAATEAVPVDQAGVVPPGDTFP